MPALANPRHERFAQAIFQGMAKNDYSQGKAYIAAGYKPNPEGARRSASRLLTYVDGIGKRVAELQEQARRRAEVTVASIVEELEEARAIAADEKQASAMVAATSTKAKILGLSVERHEHGTPGSFEQAKSTSELAEGMLKERRPDIARFEEWQLEGALAAFHRFNETLDAIASGTGQLTQS